MENPVPEGIPVWQTAKEGIKAFFNNFTVLAILTAITYLPTGLFYLYFGRFPAFGWPFWLFLLTSVIMTSFLYAAVPLVLVKRQTGDTVTVADILTQASGRLGAMLWTSLISFVIIAIGFVLLIIPGIILTVYCVLSFTLVAIRGLSGIAALQQSYRLVKHHWWTTLLFFLATLFLTFLLILASSLVFALLTIILYFIMPASLLTPLKAFGEGYLQWLFSLPPQLCLTLLLLRLEKFTAAPELNQPAPIADASR